MVLKLYRIRYILAGVNDLMRDDQNAIYKNKKIKIEV